MINQTHQPETEKFWRQRYSDLGHTGWKDPVIYAYDQQERLGILSSEVDALAVKPKIALDFGCGSGDFSSLLLKKGYVVYGYDPYVDSGIIEENFHHVNDLEEIKRATLGLIISITVFDHIVNDHELRTQLRLLRDRISQDGWMIMIEYALDESADHCNTYQSFRTLAEFRSILADCGWQVIGIDPVPHPNLAPSLGYLAYRQNPMLKIVKQVHRIGILRSYLTRRLHRYAQLIIKKHKPGFVRDSPLKLIRCQPIPPVKSVL